MEVTDVKVFSFEEIDDIRIFMNGDNPWWVAKDIARTLGYSETEALTRRLDDEEKNTCTDNSSGQGRSITLINESGLYSAILSSNKPESKKFKKWVTGTVLPSIRKTGGYLSGNVDFTDPDNIQKVLDNWKIERSKRIEAESKLAIAKPKADFYDQVAESKDAIDMKTVAAVLNINGLGRNNLFDKLRKLEILDANNMPYRKYQDAGYFRVIETKFIDIYGDTHINIKTLVYQRGLDFIRKAVTK